MSDAAGEVEGLSAGTILKKTARGAGWVIGWRTFTRSLGLISTLVLARLLVPADFGLVALGTALSGSLDALSSIGVEEALVREAAVGRDFYDTGFTLNLLRGAGTAAVLVAAAWPAADFFGDPRLVTVILVLAFTTLCGAVKNIGTVDYLRELDFRKEFILLSLPRLLSFLVTLAAAVTWRSYWALLAGILTGQVLGAALSYVMHPYRPSLSLRRVRAIWGFSVWTWAIGVAAMVRDRTATVLIGRFLGTAEVGTYSVGFEIATLPITEFLSPLGRACFPAFAAARHQGGNGAEVLLRVTSAAMAASVPAAIGISAVADPAVRLLLGTKWLGAIPVVQVLGGLSLTVVLWLLCEMALSAYGHLTTMFRLTLAFSIVRSAALVMAVPAFGLMGAVYAAGIAAAVEHVAWLIVTFRRFDVRVSRLFARSWRVVLASGVMALVLAGLGLGWTAAPGSLLSVAEALALPVAVGAVSYVAVLMGLWLVSGRPDGPEADLVTLAQAFLRRLAPWMR